MFYSTGLGELLDHELTMEPAPPPPQGGIFGTMIFLYHMVCSIQKKMSYWPIQYVTTSKMVNFCILNTKTPMYQVI